MRRIVMTLALIFSVSACHWRRAPEERAAKVNEYVADKFELNEQQAARFKAVTTQGLSIVKEFQKQREQDLSWLTEMVGGTELDRARLLAMYENHRAVLDQQMPQLIDELLEFHKSLSPEQKAELAKKLKAIQDHMRER